MVSENKTIRRAESGHKKRVGGLTLKSRLRSKIRGYPSAEKKIIKLWHPIKFSFWKAKWRIETLIGSQRGVAERNIEINKIFFINPQKIEFCSLKEFSLKEFKGQILGDDWDQLENRFDRLDLYQAIVEVCSEGKPWEKTTFYQQTLEDINRGHIHYGCRNEAELIQHCQKIENLYRSIRDSGYKSQNELFMAGRIDDPLVADEEIAVSIGRYGDLLFSDGAHRLAIAKLLGINSIPVKVAVRHKEWIKFRDELVLYARDGKSSKESKLYQPITHIDLANLPASHESSIRFQLIKNNTSIRAGRLLDLGASLGYFCHRFEEIGLDCVAVENDPSTVYFLKRLARAENKKFRIITDSILDSTVIRSTHFHIILALNIFHHFLKTQETFEKLVELLNNLQMDELFFESHLKDEYQMEGAYKNFSPDEFIRFILDNTTLDKYKLIGNMQDGRPIYKLFR